MDPGLADRAVHRYLQQPRHLGGADHLAVVVAALDEQPLGVRLLEKAGPDPAGGEVRGKREHRHAFAMRIVETLNKVDAAWAATPRAYGQPPGEPGLCGGKSGFLVVNVGPFSILYPRYDVRHPP